MKRLVAIFFILAFWDAHAQYPKWIIRFTDKNNSPYSISTPSAFLSEKAIERRTKYHIAIDSTDLPVNPSYVQQVLAAGNVQLLNESKWLNQILIYCTDNATINTINQLPFVISSQSIGMLQAQEQPYEKFDEKIKKINLSSFAKAETNDTLNYGTSYNQVHIHNGEFLHNKGYTGDGITIAMLDAGFYHYKELSAFDSVRLQGKILGEKDFVDYDNSVDEDDEHGMHCLSTIAANIPGTMVGTAPHASFWLLRSENTASEYPVEEQNWAAAAEFADSAGADMISSSLGYYYFDDAAFNHSYADIYANTTTVSKAAAMAVKKGMIVTNSAGNEGNNAWKYIIFPADADSVCAVGAVDGNGNIASFSSYGYPGKVKPQIVSVGAGTIVFGTNNIPVSSSGTSYSNPNINGLIACLWQAFPVYDNITILNAVYQSADRYNNPDNRYGYGIPDMQKAYLILKQKQNTELYGNDWLFATPDTFTATISVKLIGQVYGKAALTLIDPNGNTVQQLTLTTEAQEVYDTSFTQLQFLPAGRYTLRYSDSIHTRAIILQKLPNTSKDWIVAAPVPFNKTLSVYFTAPETGNIEIRLIDISGKTIESSGKMAVVTNNYYSVYFTKAASLPKAVYFIEYVGSQKKTIKIVK